jgi:integrase/recombinase XerD
MQYPQYSRSRSQEPTGVSAPRDHHLTLGTLLHEGPGTEDPQTTSQPRETSAPSQRELARGRMLAKIAGLDLPGKDYFTQYIHYKYRKNCKPNTIDSTYSVITQFLAYLKHTQIGNLEHLSRSDVEGFFEHQQDRELKVRTLKTHMGSVYAFVRFLADEGIVSSDLLFRKVRIKAPDSLRRNICHEDIETLLSVIEDPRDRAMVLLLLRTGMRIGELLNTRMRDICLEEQTIRIEQSEKTGDGRVVYFSNDAAEALYEWLLVRDFWKERLIYGQGRESITYAAARKRFVKYLSKSGLKGRGYSLHCLRHTFATNMLRAGVALEVVRDLLGHSSLDQTQHYAKLVDRIREEEFFKAMAAIEGGDNHEPD